MKGGEGGRARILDSELGRINSAVITGFIQRSHHTSRWGIGGHWPLSVFERELLASPYALQGISKTIRCQVLSQTHSGGIFLSASTFFSSVDLFNSSCSRPSTPFSWHHSEPVEHWSSRLWLPLVDNLAGFLLKNITFQELAQVPSSPTSAQCALWTVYFPVDRTK